MLTSRFRGFTLIELLIVVAIIAILAAIALPNFMEAQVRAKVSRVKNDFRTIATSLEAYCADYNKYPADALPPVGAAVVPVPYQGFCMLTSPVSYMSQAYEDVFCKQRKDGLDSSNPNPDPNLLPGGLWPLQPFDCRYEMGTGGPEGPDSASPSMWVLASYGPDRDDDTNVVSAFPYTAQACPYDATNGTTSNGDIYRVGPSYNVPVFATGYNPLTDWNTPQNSK